MRTPFIRLAIAFAAALSTATLAAAQPASENESISLALGDIFEIIPSTRLANPEFSWILTQDRNFIQAERSPLFRYRFIEPKTYTLIGSIQSGDQSQVIQRTFTIDVLPRSASGSASAASMASGSAATLVYTLPVTNSQGKAVLAKGRETLKIIPKNGDAKPLTLDTNLRQDTDGDGSPANDIDNQDTFFRTDATPLYLWLTSLTESQSIDITAPSGPSGGTRQTIEVMTEEYAGLQGFSTSPISIVMTPVSATEFDFAATVDASVASPSLLYQWDFGDGEESLLTNPRHAYASPGNYSVTLRVRNLETGKDIGSISTNVDASAASDASRSSGDAASSAPATDEGAAGGITGVLLAAIPYALLLAISLMIGTVGVFLFGKMKKKTSISDTFASMEAKIVDQPAAAKNPPPLEIKKSAPAASVAKPDVPKQAVATAPAAAKPAAPQMPKPPVAPSAPKPAPPSDPQPPKPAAPQTPSQEPTVNPDNAPDWLKKGMTTAQPVSPAQPAAPAQVAQQPKPQAPAVPQPPKAPVAPAVPTAPKAPVVPQAPVTPVIPKPPAPVVPQPPKPVAPVTPSAPATPVTPAIPKPVPPPPAPPKPPVAPAPAPVPPTVPAPPAIPVTPMASATLPTPPAPVIPAAPATPPVIPAAPVPTVQAPVVMTPPSPIAPVTPAPVAPTAPPAPQQSTASESKPLTEGRDEPIAIIRAESLNPPQPQNPSQSA